jgi:hypothetical protein
MRIGSPLPAFDGATDWIGARPREDEIAGRPVLVHFWSTGCPLCHEGAELIERWRAAYEPRGLACVGIYQLRPEEMLDVERVRADAHSLRFDSSCAIDGRRSLEKAFASEFAPGYYFFDRDHFLSHRQMGNASLPVLERQLELALRAEGPIDS